MGVGECGVVGEAADLVRVGTCPGLVIDTCAGVVVVLLVAAFTYLRVRQWQPISQRLTRPEQPGLRLSATATHSSTTCLNVSAGAA